jgi:hypothetical protein
MDNLLPILNAEYKKLLAKMAAMKEQIRHEKETHPDERLWLRGGIDRTCAVFGCPKHLSLIEAMAGNVCTTHMERTGHDATKHCNF